MGSIMSKIEELNEEEQWKKDLEWLAKIAKEVTDITPSTPQFTDLQWLVANRSKILRNKQLINL